MLHDEERFDFREEVLLTMKCVLEQLLSESTEQEHWRADTRCYAPAARELIEIIGHKIYRWSRIKRSSWRRRSEYAGPVVERATRLFS